MCIWSASKLNEELKGQLVMKSSMALSLDPTLTLWLQASVYKEGVTLREGNVESQGAQSGSGPRAACGPSSLSIVPTVPGGEERFVMSCRLDQVPVTRPHSLCSLGQSLLFYVSQCFTL